MVNNCWVSFSFRRCRLQATKIYMSFSSVRDFLVRKWSLVYCTKCGTNHTHDATVCIQCGAPLYGASDNSKPYWSRRRYERDYRYYQRGRLFIGVFIGLILILAGLSALVSEFYGINVPWLPIMFILVGIFILIHLFQVRNRRR